MIERFDMTMGPNEVRALYYATSEALRLWPGSPQRPHEEQETLDNIKKALFAMIMEMVVEQDSFRKEP